MMAGQSKVAAVFGLLVGLLLCWRGEAEAIVSLARGTPRSFAKPMLRGYGRRNLEPMRSF